MSNRKIICDDALDWLPKNRDLGSIVTSLPDMEEIGLKSSTAYVSWFHDAAGECFKSTSHGHPTIFYQTDRLINGRRLSKFFNLYLAARNWNRHLVWHKIVLRKDAGKIDLRRPGYSHLICFGDEKVRPGKPTADVIPMGKPLYPNGMNLKAAHTALSLALKHGVDVADPFCGMGTVPCLAEDMGFDTIIGVDIDEKQAASSRSLRLYKHKFGGKRERL